MSLNFDELFGDTIDALRHRGHSDEAIEAMTPSKAFSEYCNWHGLINWGDELWALMEELNRAETKNDRG